MQAVLEEAGVVQGVVEDENVVQDDCGGEKCGEEKPGEDSMKITGVQKKRNIKTEAAK